MKDLPQLLGALADSLQLSAPMGEGPQVKTAAQPKVTPTSGATCILWPTNTGVWNLWPQLGEKLKGHSSLRVTQRARLCPILIPSSPSTGFDPKSFLITLRAFISISESASWGSPQYLTSPQLGSLRTQWSRARELLEKGKATVLMSPSPRGAAL